jgi:hypothetical protein
LVNKLKPLFSEMPVRLDYKVTLFKTTWVYGGNDGSVLQKLKSKENYIFSLHWILLRPYSNLKLEFITSRRYHIACLKDTV